MIFTARKNLKLDVSDRQVQILVGCLLGDAYLTKLGKIQIEQSDKQKKYVDWKYQELASISYSQPKVVIRFEKADNRVTKSLRFWTRQYFRIWRNIFYRDNHKVYPEVILRKSGKLRIRSKSLPKFFELIRPYIHQSMVYKVP